MNHIVVVGSLNVDLSMRTAQIPAPGETTRASDLGLGPGGKGLNQAVAAARLGATVHMVGRVGDDPLAEIPLSALREAKVETEFVEALVGETTGTASIVVEESTGQNAIVVAAGANGALAIDHVRLAAPVFRQASVLLVQLEAPNETGEAALVQAGELGLTRILDPAPFRPLSDSLLAQVDILTPNEIEASDLAEMKINDVASATLGGRKIFERVRGDVVITLGERGCVWVTSGAVHHIEAPPVESVDTTGAGDAFNGALARCVAEQLPMKESLAYAVAAGSASTKRPGAALSMPTRDEVEAVLAQSKA